MPSTVTTPLLNAALIVSRRLELSLSQRQLADLSDLSAPTIGRIEAGESAPDLSLGNLHRLAEALALEPWELLRSTTTSETIVGHDDARVEAILVEAGRLVRKEEIADAMEWDLARTNAAIDALGDRLEGTGLRLHRHAEGSVAVRPAPIGLTEVERERAARAARQHRGLNRRTARLLSVAAATGEISRRDLSNANDQRVACGELMNAGVLIDTPKSIALSDEARYSLMLDDE